MGERRRARAAMPEAARAQPARRVRRWEVPSRLGPTGREIDMDGVGV